MISYHKLSEHPKAFYDLCGMTLEECDELYKNFEATWSLCEKERLTRLDRRRALGGGNHYTRDLRTHLVMVLLRLHLNMTTEAVGYLFGLHKSTVSRNGRRIWQVLHQVSGPKSGWPEPFKRGHGLAIEEALSAYPDLVAMMGATENLLRRLEGAGMLPKRDSGKQKGDKRKRPQLTNNPLVDEVNDNKAGGVQDRAVPASTTKHVNGNGSFDYPKQVSDENSAAATHKSRRNYALADIVTDRLRDAIICGRFKSGQSLREEQLASMFQVSRGPVREALTRLERERLVQVRRHRGTTVSWLSPSDVEDVYTLRLALERLAVQNAVVRATDRDFNAMEEVIDAFDKALAEDPSEHEIARLDLQFHDIIYAAARHQRLQDTWTNLRAQVYIFLLARNIANPDFRDLTIGGHRVILNVLRSRDAEQAIFVIEEHLTAAYQRVVVDFARHRINEAVPEREQDL